MSCAEKGVLRLRKRVNAADGAQFAVICGLDAHGQPIDTGFAGNREKVIRHRVGIGLCCNLRIRFQRVVCANGIDNTGDACTAEQTRCAAAQIDRIDRVILTGGGLLNQFGQQPLHIGVALFQFAGQRVKVAIAAFCRAKRHVNINAELILHPA